MVCALAYAEGPDTTDSGLAIVVIALLIVAGVGLLAAIPMIVARRRSNAHTDGIRAILVIWAILAAGSAIYVTNANMTWSREFTRQMMSGYRDPQDQADRPATPWALWSVLGLIYAATTVAAKRASTKLETGE